MPTIKPTKQVLIALVCTGVLLLLGGGFLYYNRSCRLTALQHDIKVRQEKLDNSRQIAIRLTEVEQEYQNAQDKLGILERGVSSRAFVPTLLRQLEELGKSVNLQVAGVRPRLAEVEPPAAAGPDGKPVKKKAVAEPYHKLNIDIETNGKYWDVVRFLHAVTLFPKIVAVHDLQITPSSLTKGEVKSMASPMLNVKINATAFILKEAEKPVNSVTASDPAVPGHGPI